MSQRDSQQRTATTLRDEPGRADVSASAIPGGTAAHAQTPPAAQATQRAPKADHRSAGEWTNVERAAAILGLAPVSLRRALEREARKRADGSIVAQWDGVVGRKLGRVWRVWLDARWRNPTAAE